MFFFAREWAGPTPFEFIRAPSSMGLFAGHPADYCIADGDFFSELPAPRAPLRRGWKVGRSPGGMAVLLAGWLDNPREVAAKLNIHSDNPAILYGAAVERWGDQADREIIGDYAALVCLPDGTVRLSRSPFCSKSIFWHATPDALLVSSIPRPLFAAGVPKRLRSEAVDALLCMELPDPNHSMFEGVRTVPTGTVALISRGSSSQVSWYDPLAIPSIRFPRDEDYIEAANALLAEAVGKAMAGAQKPGMTLSGGLDSSLVCAEALRQMPGGKRLTSFTFQPIAEWKGRVAAHKFGSDRPYVEAFAAMHPNLDPVFVDNRGIGFDDRAEQVFLACDAGYPARVLGSVYHGPLDAAREHGCDWLLFASLGNATISCDAPWASAEFFRRGQWRQLWQLAANRLNDPRPMWRRIASHGAMPNMPPPMQNIIRRLMRTGRDVDKSANFLLNPNGRLGEFRREDRISKNIMSWHTGSTQADFIRRQYYTMGLGAETADGYEQVFGVRMRDVTAYRPLMEFCFGLPTGQFVRDGESRWLARRMAVGKMPEAQRTNRLYGEHNTDWHERMTPRVDEFRQQVRSIANHPELGPLVDTDQALALLDNWPELAPDDADAAAQLRFFLPAVLYIARYVDHMTGRNPN
jgi:asparagine synthase (glutamine-hydrolysing)